MRTSARRSVAAGLAAAAVAAAAVVIAPPVGAAPLGRLTPRELRIDQYVNGDCTVVVRAVVPYSSREAAQYAIDNGVSFYITLRADDLGFDEILGGPYRVQQDVVSVTDADEVGFTQHITSKSCSDLDEDDVLFDLRDEIYAGIDYYGLAGSTQYRETRVWRGYL